MGHWILSQRNNILWFYSSFLERKKQCFLIKAIYLTACSGQRRRSAPRHYGKLSKGSIFRRLRYQRGVVQCLPANSCVDLVVEDLYSTAWLSPSWLLVEWTWCYYNYSCHIVLGLSWSQWSVWQMTVSFHSVHSACSVCHSRRWDFYGLKRKQKAWVVLQLFIFKSCQVFTN